MRVIKELVIHQTATKVATLAAVRDYHIRVLGWSDIGYHYLLQPGGTIETGRQLEIAGAHVSGANAESVGICLVGAGNAFPVNQGYMRLPMWHSLLRLVLQLIKEYGIRPEAIRGHREYPSGQAQGKTCPGWDVAGLRDVLIGKGL